MTKLTVKVRNYADVIGIKLVSRCLSLYFKYTVWISEDNRGARLFRALWRAKTRVVKAAGSMLRL